MLSRRFLASGYSLRAAQRSSLWREKRFEYPYRDKYKPQLFLSFSLPLLLTLAVLLLPILLPGTLRMESSPKTTPSPRVTNTFKHKRLKDDHKCQSKRRYLDDGDGWSRQSDWPPACHGLKCVARNTLYKSVILTRSSWKVCFQIEGSSSVFRCRSVPGWHADRFTHKNSSLLIGCRMHASLVDVILYATF